MSLTILVSQLINLGILLSKKKIRVQHTHTYTHTLSLSLSLCILFLSSFGRFVSQTLCYKKEFIQGTMITQNAVVFV